MSLFKQFAGQTIIYGLGHVLGRVLNYVLIAFYLTRKLVGQEAEYGIYNEMYFYVAILFIFLGLRMETTFFRFGRGDNSLQAFSTAVWSVFIVGALWWGVACWKADTFAAWLSYPDKGVYVKILSTLLLVDVLIAMPLAKMRLDNRPGQFVLFQVGSVLLNIAFVLFFLEWCPRMGWDQWYHSEDLIRDVFLANLLARGIILLLLSPRLMSAGIHLDYSLWKKMVTYAWPLIIVGLAGVINQSSYIILQKYWLPGDLMQNLSDGGVYAASAKVALLMSIFVTAYNFAAEPFFFNQLDRDDAPYIYAQMLEAFAWVGCFIFLVISLYTDVFGNIVGSSYRETMYVVPIILMGYLFLGLYYNVAVWYKVTDSTIYGALISLIGVLVTFSINALFMSKWGVIASAYATLFCYLVMWLVCVFFGKKRYPVPYVWRNIIASIIFAAGLLGVWLWLSPGNSFLGLRPLLLLVFLMFFWFLEKNKLNEWLGYQ